MGSLEQASLAHYISQTPVYANSQTHKPPHVQQKPNPCLSSFGGSFASGYRLPYYITE